jgi:hypothetical protein
MQALSYKRFNNEWLAMGPAARITSRMERKHEANRQIREERFKPTGGIQDLFFGLLPNEYPESERLLDICSGLLVEVEILNGRILKLEKAAG